MRSVARTAYRRLASLFLVGVIAEFFLAGLGVFRAQAAGTKAGTTLTSRASLQRARLNDQLRKKVMWSWPFSDAKVRAMYAGGRADARGRRFARLWTAVFGLGLVPKRWVTLEVVGRRSGRVVRFPLGMADWEGQWYLVPMLGDHCNWVQNVRATHGQATLRHRRAIACRLVELPVHERPPIIKRYLQVVPGARPHIPVDRKAPVEQFETIASDYPVFRVDAGSARNPVLYAPGRQRE